MNIDRAPHRQASSFLRIFGFGTALLCLATALMAQTFTIKVDYSGSQSGNLVVVVSTQHVAETNLTGSVVVSTTIASPTFPHYANFNLSGGTSYYFYAFKDSDSNNSPNGYEPMGGYGPFPIIDISAVQPINFVSGSTYTVTLNDRARVSGNANNPTATPGTFLVVAIPTFPVVNTYDPAVVRRYIMTGNYAPYIMEGLAPNTSYFIKAFVDKDSNSFPDPNFEPIAVRTVYVSALSNLFGQDLAISASSATFQGSAPDNIIMKDNNGGNFQTVVASTPSQNIKISINDMWGLPTISTNPVVVTFYPPMGVELSSTNFVTNFTTLTIASGMSTSPQFKMRSSTQGNVWIYANAMDFPQAGQSRYASYGFNVLPAGYGFTNVRIRTDSGSGGGNQTSVSITPDHDGVDDAAIFRCSPPDSSSGWELIISTDPAFPYGSEVSRFWGYGEQDMYWYGYDYNGRPVPNGTYYARFQMPGGGISSSNLTVTVISYAIFGKVTVSPSASTPVANASINIWGSGGGGSSYTDANGNYFVGGLKANQYYTVNINKTGFASKSLNNIQPSGTAQDFQLDMGATIRVQAARQYTGNDPDVWGNINIHTNDYTTQAYGTLHFMYNSTTSDNGAWSGDTVSFTTYTDVGVSAGKDYKVDIYLPNFGQYTKQITIPAGSSGIFPVVWTSTEIVRKANAFGWVVLPSTPDAPGASISIQATKAGDSYPTVYGGGWIQSDTYYSTTSMRYQLYGLAPGQWTFRAQVQGYRSQSISVNISTSDVYGGTTDYADFATFTAGGGVTGTVQVIGDTTNLGSSSGGGSCCGTQGPAGTFSLFVNAWSPTSYQGAWKTVYIATHPTTSSAAYTLTGLDDGTYQVYSFLSGFQMEPPGQKVVTVSNGVGSLDLTFRKLSGRIDINLSLPGDSDPTKVSYEVQLDQRYGNGGDPNQTSGGNLSGYFVTTSTSVTGLGTGLYRVIVEDKTPGHGLRKEVAVSVINGVTSTVNIDLNQTSFSISGTVSFQGSLILPSTWSVTVSSADGLNAVTSTASLVQVFSFPLPEHFYGSDVKPTKSTILIPDGNGNATFNVPGLLPGTYLVRVQEDLNPPMNFGGPGSSGSQPEFATTNQVANITNGSVSGVALTLSNGVELSGTISRPDSDTDTRAFRLTLRRSDNLSVFTSSATSTGAGTASYKFQHLAAGDYILEVQEQTYQTSGGGTTSGAMSFIPPKYAVAPKRITIGGSSVTQDISLQKAGVIVGQLRDSDSNTLITSNNKSQFLPSNFYVNAQANPWFEGGYASAEWDHNGGNGIGISSTTGQFSIYRVIPDLFYDVSFRRSEGGLDDQSAAKGQKAYAALVKGGIRVTEGQTVDLGIVDLKQGVSISGIVKDVEGTPLSNIRVQAIPSITQGGDNKWQLTVEAFTNDKGQYVLQGVDRDKLYYDVVAAPRFEAGDLLSTLGGKKYGTETLQMIDVTKASARENVDFALTEANGVLSGKVVTIDGGALQEPFNESGNFTQNVARVVLHQEGAVSSNDDPLGEIEEVTDTQGNFSINTLKPGSYVMRVISVGYVTYKKNVVVSAGQTSVGTITLEKGASVSGTITKPDGSNPSTDEVNMVVGVDEDFQEFVFGSVKSNKDANIVTGYTLTGFKTGLNYSLMIISGSDDLLEAKSNLVFSASTETKTINLLYRPAPPTVFATQSRVGNQVTIRFFSTHKFRNLTPDDSDLSKIVTLTSGKGAITTQSMSSSRDTITVVYDIPSNESSFKVRLNFTSIIVDPDSASGANFTFDKEFHFFGGVGRMRRVSIANATGGNAKMEGIPMGENFTSGCFSVDRSSRVEVILLSATSLDDLSGGAPAAAPAARAQSVMGAAQRLGPAAYPSESLFKAVNLAPAVSPFSDFYEILLPAGISHTLKKEALLTLHYDSSVTDPSKINVYYFDPGNNVFLLEANKRVVDTKNKTITVAVTHASTFVVLQNNAAVVGANDYTGQEIFVYNFPNPFNLKTKTVSLNNAPSAPTQTIGGTMIKYALPVGKTGTVKIEIYTMVGELVRTITQDSPTGGTYYYVEWNGKNDAGKNVASGVYLARMTLNGGEEKFFKMAVIK